MISKTDIYSWYQSFDDTEMELKILVVDDNRDFANILCSLLKHLDYSAYVAYDKKQAMEKLRRLKPDLVFCDIGLPNRGGYEIADKIKTDDDLQHAYLAGLTYNLRDRSRLARELGFDAYVTKPIQTSALNGILKKVAEKKTGIESMLHMANA